MDENRMTQEAHKVDERAESLLDTFSEFADDPSQPATHSPEDGATFLRQSFCHDIWRLASGHIRMLPVNAEEQKARFERSAAKGRAVEEARISKLLTRAGITRSELDRLQNEWRARPWVYAGVGSSAEPPLRSNTGATTEDIATAATEKIATYPAASQNYIQAVILDALNEAVDIERHRAEVERKVFET